jgi:TolB protein
MQRLIVCLFVFMSSVLAAEPALEVRLPTQTQLQPLYLSQITSEDTEFDQEYLSKLQAVLKYDLEHNGITQVLSQTPEKEKLARDSYSDPSQHLSAWRQAQTRFVVIPRVQANHFSVRLIGLPNNVVKEICEVALSGDLDEDRRRIHEVADSIHYELFGKEGIATTRILFTRRQGEASGKPSSEVWEADYDGALAHQVTHDGAYCVTPVYIPPSPGMVTRHFAYVTYRWGQPKLLFGSINTGKCQRLTLLQGNQLLPAVSYQRDKIAFICDVTGNPDLFIQPFSVESGAIGKPQQVFSAAGAVQGTPTFCPDGKQIAFVSNKAGQPQIYVMAIPKPGTPLKGLQPKVISTRARNGTAPAWSPDGTKIAFTATTDGVRQLWIYEFDTEQEYQLTFGPGNKENASWAPNSLHLVYNTADPSNAELFMIDLHRAQPVRIALGAGEKRFPSWEPRIPRS